MLDQALIREMQKHVSGLHAHIANRALVCYQKLNDEGMQDKVQRLEERMWKALNNGHEEWTDLKQYMRLLW